MFLEALIVMITGMLSVFAILAILIQCMRLTAWLVARAEARRPRHAGPDATGPDGPTLAAIAAAAWKTHTRKVQE
ncbi:MAG: hypothetical protein FJ224_11725 [Lentisphaerae bacterium]|nr:hypothetical protein [Lentisphaerota bacterium]